MGSFSVASPYDVDLRGSLTSVGKSGVQLGIFEGSGPIHEKGTSKLFKRRYSS